MVVQGVKYGERVGNKMGPALVSDGEGIFGPSTDLQEQRSPKEYLLT